MNARATDPRPFWERHRERIAQHDEQEARQFSLASFVVSAASDRCSNATKDRNHSRGITCRTRRRNRFRGVEAPTGRRENRKLCGGV